MEKTLKQLVYKAIHLVYENDYYLISNKPTYLSAEDKRNHVSERSIMFRFAYYLQSLLKQYKAFDMFDLDCEYNRNGADVKSIPGYPNGAIPDVILHKRGCNDFNLLIIEIKTYWNNNQNDDFSKIIAFTNQAGTYKYKMGMTILFGETYNDVKINIFRNGNKEYRYL